MVSNQTMTSLTTSSANISSTSALSSPSLSSSPPLSENSNDSSGPEVGSIFTFDPQILQPFMGLQSVDRADDPWHHKAYNLYQPIFTGGGTFEEYIKTGRYKRDLNKASASSSLSRDLNEASESSLLTSFSKQPQVLTPEMLVHLLRIKSSFKKNYPGLYKTMMGKFDKDKSNSITITPPEVPKHVSYKNVELAAAEINPLESLIPSYQQDLENILKAQKEKELPGSLENSYKTELNFWANSQEVQTADEEEAPIISSSSLFNSDKNEKSFWDNSQETLQTLDEDKLKEPEKISFNEQQHLWENSQESLKLSNKEQLVAENSKEIVNPEDYSSTKEHNQEALSYWENSQEILKTLNEQKELLGQIHDNTNKEHPIWETVEETQGEEDQALKPNAPNSLKEDYKIWQRHFEPSPVQKRSSFWDELEAAEEEDQNQQQHSKHLLDDSEPIFDFDEDIE